MPDPADPRTADPRTALLAVDAPAAVEVGVTLLGLDPERLLAGLGLAALADEAGRVAVAVDRLRHGAPGPDFAALVGEGARRWRSVRPQLAGAAPDPRVSASVRQAWTTATRALEPALAGAGPATRVHLVACWLRRADVDRTAGRTDTHPGQET